MDVGLAFPGGGAIRKRIPEREEMRIRRVVRCRIFPSGKARAPCRCHLCRGCKTVKIIFINRFFYPDHSPTSALMGDLAFHLASQGIDVLVITSRQRYDEPEADLSSTEERQGAQIHRIWTTRFGRGRLPFRLVDYLTFYAMAG